MEAHPGVSKNAWSGKGDYGATQNHNRTANPVFDDSRNLLDVMRCISEETSIYPTSRARSIDIEAIRSSIRYLDTCSSKEINLAVHILV